MLNNPDSPARLSQLQALKAQNSSLKIILSVGGWGADNFSDADFQSLEKGRPVSKRGGLTRLNNSKTDVLKKLTSVSVGVYCEKCIIENGTVVVDNIAFEK